MRMSFWPFYIFQAVAGDEKNDLLFAAKQLGAAQFLQRRHRCGSSRFREHTGPFRQEPLPAQNLVVGDRE